MDAYTETQTGTSVKIYRTQNEERRVGAFNPHRTYRKNRRQTTTTNNPS